MKLVMNGWNRKVYDRELIDVDLSKSNFENLIPYDGLNKTIINSLEGVTKYTESIPEMKYMFRVHIGEKTMGGDYATEMYFSKSDVLSMFMDMFGNLSFAEICEMIAASKQAKAKIEE